MLLIFFHFPCWKSGKGFSLHYIVFNLACVLLALDFSSTLVGLYGPPLLLSHVLFALIVAVTHISQTAAPHPVALFNGETATSVDHFD